ncbi:MAG: LysM peptidoglycan-binding domain-containing protein [Candidatus Dormibacteraceae bacterium]
MYASTDQDPIGSRRSGSLERSRRVGYGRLSARRPPRSVAPWRRAVRNLVIGGSVLGLLLGMFTTSVLGATRSPAQIVVVGPGQTLWSIAESRYPNQDPRQIVQEIDQENHISGGAVYPGQRLRLPQN